MGDRRLAREIHIGLRLFRIRDLRAGSESVCAMTKVRECGPENGERERKGSRKKKGTRRYLLESRRDTKRPSATAGPRIAVYLAPTTTTRWLLLPCPVRWIRRLAARLLQGRSFRVGVTPGASRRYPPVDNRVLPPPSSPRVRKTRRWGRTADRGRRGRGGGGREEVFAAATT